MTVFGPDRDRFEGRDVRPCTVGLVRDDSAVLVVVVTIVLVAVVLDFAVVRVATVAATQWSSRVCSTLFRICRGLRRNNNKTSCSVMTHLWLWWLWEIVVVAVVVLVGSFFLRGGWDGVEALC